ncbi:MAG: flagellar hook-associated protein FlgK [Rubrivivax sp.]|nr:flagellar hook-associated protein FlgK [Rubrivivax sp.]
MSASPLMSLGVKALTANYAGLQTTGHNIANANVAGFSRQQAEFSTSPGQFTGSGFFGRGVDVATVSRAHSGFLTREAASARALSAMDSARLAQLQRLETVFKPGEMGLGAATSEFMAAMSDLSSRPADLSARQVVLARAGDLAARFAEAGDALDLVQAGVHAELRVAVSEVNSIAKSIASTNQRIAELRGLGQPANDLLDQRDRLISRLSTHVQVTRMEAEDGTMAVFIAGGQRLVLGTEAATLKVLQDESDPSRAAIGVTEGSVQRRLGAAALGGSLGGVLRFQNEDMVSAQTLVGQLAAAVGGAVNDQQLHGLNLQPPLGQVPSAALFGIGPPQALPHAANARDALGNARGGVSLTVTNPAALQASEYNLQETTPGSGAWMLTRWFDGQSTPVVSGDTVDGMRIDFTGTPQPGDRFLLQPVNRAANGMQRLLNEPQDLAAASSLLATRAAANVGTAAVASLVVNSAPLPTPGATARITFTSNTGDYSWGLYDSGNTLLSSGSATWQAGVAIPAPPADINGFTLQMSGVPRTGDVLTVEPTPAAAIATNNGNALALLALRDAGITLGRTATDAWASALADIGVRVQSGQTAADIAASVAGQTEAARSGQAGVNLDEEAARLIQYQQSYQAAAKILQVAQQLFDTLLDVAG